MQHYLRPLIAPRSVALVGASEREGSVGRIALANLLGGRYEGAVYAVNPGHASVLGHPALRSLRDIGEPVDLAVIATPADAVLRVLDDAGARNIPAAVIMTAPPVARAREWGVAVAARARSNGIRFVGAGAFGVIRTDIGLNATFCAPSARPGRLALVSQSGAVATALLDFAAPQNLGFSTVISLGTGLDVSFGEMLDVLVTDPGTDGILLYVEDVAHARPFVSALRSAARTKPVVVLKAGRSVEPARVPPTDRVVDAALSRAGAVRVQNYTELFAAARILASGRVPRGDHLAIVSNGRGPALLAADRVAARGVALATLAPATVHALDGLLPESSPRANPVDLRGDAPPQRLAEAIDVLVRDPGVDAVVALHVPRPAMPAEAAAARAADVAREARKLVLGAWLGALDRADVQAALEAGNIVNFYTPENAVDAFAFLATYRRNQALLLEVPPLTPEPVTLDLDLAERMRARLAQDGRSVLVREELAALLGAFGIRTAPFAVAFTHAEAEAAAATLRFPVTLRALHGTTTWSRTARTRAALASAWAEIAGAEGRERPRVVIEKPTRGVASALAVHVSTDPTFGPVISVGAPAHLRDGQRIAVMLPPLSRTLAEGMLDDARARGAPDELPAPVRRELDAALVALLLRVSALVGALPWVTDVTLSSLTLVGTDLVVGDARAHVDPQREAVAGYRHMAIHPYPVELIDHVTLRDGTPLTIRPIRPEDGELERDFMESLSAQSRYFRFFYQLTALTPAMIARFTQVDYDRELALVAVVEEGPAAPRTAFVGVARYVANPDGQSAEFAVVVSDAWHKRGIARALMARLIGAATRRRYARLEGVVLRANKGMLAFTEELGFTARDDPEASDQVIVSLDLASRYTAAP